MHARDFMEMNKKRVLRRIEESKHHPRSRQYIEATELLAFINAYEMSVGYEGDARRVRQYWENVPLIEEFDYYAVSPYGEGRVYDIEKAFILGVALTDDESDEDALLVGWDKNEITELRVRRRKEKDQP